MVLLADYWLTVLGLKKTPLLHKFFFFLYENALFFFLHKWIPSAKTTIHTYVRGRLLNFHTFVGGRFIKVRKSGNFNNCAILWENSKLMKELIKYV